MKLMIIIRINSCERELKMQVYRSPISRSQRGRTRGHDYARSDIAMSNREISGTQMEEGGTMWSTFV